MAVFPGPTNAYIPSHDATNKLVIDFARNPNKFPVNKYTQVIPVKQMTGYYLEMTVEEAGRVLHSDLRNFLWPDGMPAPEGLNGLESFVYKPFRTQRYAFPVLFGNLTTEQASWDVLAQHASIKARQAMTARTQKAITALTTTSNYSASHVKTVSSISGVSGPWDQSTTVRQDIKRSLEAACEQILDSTLAAIDLNDLILVISSGLAAKLAVTQEIVDYIKASPEALAMVKGEIPGAMYGLPDKLYGVPLVVEATRKVTSKKGATRAVSAILPDATPFIAARPGGITGVEDAPNFSTCTCFALEEMTVETLTDTPNRRTAARVVENYAYNVVAPASGVLFQGAVSS